MKPHLKLKLHHLKNGREFYSEQHDNDNYFHLVPHHTGCYSLYVNSEYQPSIEVYCLKDKLVAIGIGKRKGYHSQINLDDVQFVHLNFIDESDFVDDSNENYTASFMGEEVLLFSGGDVKPDKFHIENSLG